MRKSEGKGLIERLRERFLRQNGEKTWQERSVTERTREL